MAQFTIDRKHLLSMLLLVKQAIVRHPIIPIMEDFLFEVEGSNLRITGGTFEKTVHVGTYQVESKDIFAMVVPQTILKYLKATTDDLVKITYSPDSYHIEVHTDDDKMKYTGQNPMDYPKDREYNDLAFTTTTEIFEDLSAVCGYLSSNELSPALNQAVLKIHNDKVYWTGTDGHRLITVRLPQLDEKKLGDFKEFPIRRDVAKIISDLKFKSHSDVGVSLSFDKLNSRIAFLYNDMLVEIDSMICIDRLPNYFDVIPEESTTQYTINRTKFDKIMKKVSVMKPNEGRVAISINGKTTLSIRDDDFGQEYIAEIGGTYTGFETEISFNYELLMAVIGTFEGDVTLEMTKGNKPVVIKSGSKLALLMPIKHIEP